METFILFELASGSIYKTGSLFFFPPKLCNNGLCTSMDVEAGYCFIHYLKKLVRKKPHSAALEAARSAAFEH